MRNKQEIYKMRYKSHLISITYKRINLLMFVSLFLLLFLLYSDVIIRNNYTAVYTRIPSLTVIVLILIFKNFKIKRKIIADCYNFFLFTILVMMYAKFLIHLNTETEDLNALSIITAIFIISLEIRSGLLFSIIIYFGTYLIFFIILYSFFDFRSDEIVPLINVLLMTIVGFLINRVQNNLRYKKFKSEYLLNVEKHKLYMTNKKLENKNKDLEDFNEIFTNREFRIKELKGKVKDLEERLNNDKK